jgi:tetratricopeptide (TPR) repeat protein
MPQFFGRSLIKVLLLHACLVLAAFQLAACGSRQERAQSYYQNGKGYLEKQDFVKARIELKNALQLNADMLEAWRAVAQIDEHDKNFQALTGSLRRIVELDPKDIQSRMKLTKLFLLNGALDDALKMVNGASEIAPQNADILALKAAVLIRLKDMDGATEAAKKAVEIDPGSSEAIVMLAATQFVQNNSTGALQTLANVPKAHEDDIGVLFLKIDIYNRTGDRPQAEASLRKLVALHPEEPAYRTRLIQFLLADNRRDDAVKELRAATTANPADTNAELELVRLLGALQGPAAARSELVARINAGGRVFTYQIALAKFDFVQGSVAESTALLEKLISSSSSAAEDSVTARSTLAEMYIQQNNIAAAEPLVSDILIADSRNTNGLRLRALIHLARNQIDDAITDLRSALNDQPQSPELLATIAIAYERSGSIELADKAFLDATKASNFAPAFGLNYVEFLRRRGLNPQADNVVMDLANRNPNSIPVLSALAKVKLAQQDWNGAHVIADSIRRLDDKNAVAEMINGAAFSGQKNLNASLAALQNAYNVNPAAVQPMAALVSEYLQSHQTEKAEAFLQSVLKANPRNAEALVLSGSIQLTKNDPNQAIKDFEDAIKQQPKAAIGYRALADLYARQNKIDEARKVIRAGLQEQPKSFDLQLTLAGLMEAKGEYEPAIAEYESMLKDQPGSLIVANNLASLLADRRTDKASLEKANSLAVLLTKSQVPQFADTVGWINYRRGDYTVAVSLLENAVAKLPNLPLVRYHLGMGYLATGQDAKASEQFKKARELAPNDADLNAKIAAALKNQG